MEDKPRKIDNVKRSRLFLYEKEKVSLQTASEQGGDEGAEAP